MKFKLFDHDSDLLKASESEFDAYTQNLGSRIRMLRNETLKMMNSSTATRAINTGFTFIAPLTLAGSMVSLLSSLLDISEDKNTVKPN